MCRTNLTIRGIGALATCYFASAITLTTFNIGHASSDLPPLEAVKSAIDLNRYSGKWHVVGNIPLDIPFFSDADAENYTETYSILKDGVIELACEFTRAGNAAESKRFRFKGFVKDTSTNAEWAVQFVWPFRATYMVIYLDEDYSTTIVGVPNRSWVWIMSRDASIPEDKYQRLLSYLDSVGFDTNRIRRINNAASAST